MNNSKWLHPESNPLLMRFMARVLGGLVIFFSIAYMLVNHLNASDGFDDIICIGLIFAGWGIMQKLEWGILGSWFLIAASFVFYLLLMVVGLESVLSGIT